MPRKFTISPAKINTYLSCISAYFYTYVARISRFHYKKNIGDTFGGSLHRALNLYHKDKDTSKQKILEHMNTTWSNDGYEYDFQIEQYKAEAERIVNEYHKKNADIKIIATEKTLKKDMGDYVITGRIDRIDMPSENHIRLADYKSGRSKITKEELKENIAMRIYALLARDEYPDCDISSGIYCLKSGNEEYVSFDETEHNKTVKLLENAVWSMKQVQSAPVVDTIFMARNLENCKACIYYGLCCKKNFGIWM